jgi:hypothetical protein
MPLLLISAGVAAAVDRPNIIVIMADDLSYAELGAYGCKDIPTPHLDELAADGARFTSGYVTWPMCGPSRPGFLTGRSQATFGFYKNPTPPVDPQKGLPNMETIVSLPARILFASPRASIITTGRRKAWGTARCFSTAAK